VSEIEMIDEGWWSGTNSRGMSGLFPCNYVELVEDEEEEPQQEHEQEHPAAPVPPPADPEPEPEPEAAESGPFAIAVYEYEAAEDNEISFPEGAKIENLAFPDEDWWEGEYQGKRGLLPANYVELKQ